MHNVVMQGRPVVRRGTGVKHLELADEQTVAGGACRPAREHCRQEQQRSGTPPTTGG
jgi:hypothetical protein